ncbi:MAG: FprA family A-type flavoprotein [Gammaproteobacteria bacterium]
MSAPPTRIDNIGGSLYRIHTPLPPAVLPGGFSFNQYLLVDESPLLFHAGPRGLFDAVAAAIATVMPLDTLRYVAFCHVEADECGALNDFLAVAPKAEPLCGRVAAMTSMNDLADRPPRALADGEVLDLGRHRVQWLDAPHVPHGWENGFLYEQTTRTLFCGDLFTQPGAEHPPVVEGGIFEASEAMRAAMDYYAHGANTRPVLERLAALKPQVLACMHGSAFRGDGRAELERLAMALGS